jgi:hypothetical protein
MQIILLTKILLIIAAFTASAQNTMSLDLIKFKWKNRIILCYPKNHDAWAEQQKLIELQRIQIEDRDLIIIRLDKQQKDVPNKLRFTKAQRLALIKAYRLTPGSSLLIGKDGKAKSKQSGKLRLRPLFELIDQMPMRRAEIQSDKADE